MKKDEREYLEEALWTSLKTARREALSAQEDYKEADRERTRAENRRNNAGRKVDELKVALDAVLSGLASVEFDNSRSAFFVRFDKNNWSSKREGHPPQDIRLEVDRGDFEERGAVPRNAAHVGSTNQGMVGNVPGGSSNP